MNGLAATYWQLDLNLKEIEKGELDIQADVFDHPAVPDVIKELVGWMVKAHIPPACLLFAGSPEDPTKVGGYVVILHHDIQQYKAVYFHEIGHIAKKALDNTTPSQIRADSYAYENVGKAECLKLLQFVNITTTEAHKSGDLDDANYTYAQGDIKARIKAITKYQMD